MSQPAFAPYFTSISDVSDIRVLPPYEPKDKNAQWVRGYLRTPEGSDFVITGPRLRVCFSGCRWGKLVLAMVGVADPEGYQFQRWLESLTQHVENAIWQQPERFKPGAKTSSRFTFDHDLIKPSSDPAAFPDQLSCRLSAYRQQRLDSPGEWDEIPDVDLFRIEGGQEIKMDPSEITAGSSVIPIFRFSYFRNIERFGLVVTVLKARVFPAEARAKITNDQWVMDYPNMEE